MITGRLVEVNNKYYAILNLKHPDGQRLQKRFDLELPVPNNKRRAQEKLNALCAEYTRKQQVEQNHPNVVFIDFALAWIEKRKPEISPSTYRNYRHMVEHHMTNCFGDTPLRQISFWDIEDYYSYLEFNGLSSTTARHHHALLKCVFHEAHRLGIIQEDPTEFLKAPKRQPPKVSYYSLQEAQQLIEEVKGTKLEVPVTLSLAYGFRRSEVLGLRWEDIDFDENRIVVRHTVVEGIEDGRRILVEKDTMKARASRRTLPLFEPITTMLKDDWERKKGLYPIFVCSDSKGQMMKPDVLSHDFKKFLADHGLRHIRYQDLRHSCASLLIAAHVPLIQMPHWLGHSTVLTTARVPCCGCGKPAGCGAEPGAIFFSGRQGGYAEPLPVGS